MQSLGDIKDDAVDGTGDTSRLLATLSPRASKDSVRSTSKRSTSKDDKQQQRPKKSNSGSRFANMLGSLRRGTVGSSSDVSLSPTLSVSDPKPKAGTPTSEDRFAHQKKLREMLALQNDDGTSLGGDATPTASYSSISRASDCSVSPILSSTLASMPARRLTTTHAMSQPSSPATTPRSTLTRGSSSQSLSSTMLTDALRARPANYASSTPSSNSTSPVTDAIALPADSSALSLSPLPDTLVPLCSPDPIARIATTTTVAATTAETVVPLAPAAHYAGEDFSLFSVAGCEVAIPSSIDDRQMVHMGIVEAIFRTLDNRYAWFESHWKAIDDDERRQLMLDLHIDSRTLLLRNHAHLNVCRTPTH
jgi:hypothetical protein